MWKHASGVGSRWGLGPGPSRLRVSNSKLPAGCGKARDRSLSGACRRQALPDPAWGRGGVGEASGRRDHAPGQRCPLASVRPCSCSFSVGIPSGGSEAAGDGVGADSHARASCHGNKPPLLLLAVAACLLVSLVACGDGAGVRWLLRTSPARTAGWAERHLGFLSRRSWNMKGRKPVEAYTPSALACCERALPARGSPPRA